MGTIEGLYIFDEHNNTVLEHVYAGRPPSASTLLSGYLATSRSRPSLTYLPNTSPPSLLISLLQDRLLFLVPSSGDVDPLLVLEFLHRVADALEDFLGAPLLASKVEASYDVVAQIIGEICDAGAICSTEPNSLKEVVEVPTWAGNLLGSLQTPSLQTPMSTLAVTASATSSSGSAVPWRRTNVRHTSNELYVDIVERLSVIMAPSGRPISAFASGMIAFNAKISGVPDLMLTLTAPGGRPGVQRAMDLATFHQCVRLARWREHPGELSFVPPDGRFVLAGYECDLLPPLVDGESISTDASAPGLALPASIEMLTSQGSNGDELEVRLTFPLKSNGNGIQNGQAAARIPGIAGRSVPNSASSQSSSASPAVEDVVVSIPISAGVRNITDIRCSKGEANFSPVEASLEWRVPTREIAAVGSGGASLRCTIVSPAEDNNGDQGLANGLKLKTDAFDYDETADTTHQVDRRATGVHQPASRNPRKIAALMPKSAALSFSVRGWLASGIKVDSLTVNPKTSKGLGAGVTPYKGVKYHTISTQGVEVRCS